MTSKQREIYAAYCYNERFRLEQEIEQLQSNLRYRRISQVDCLELIIAQERLQSFIEITKNINAIFKIESKLSKKYKE